MFKFVILGLIFLFIVLNFYTDIKIFINTQNNLEGMQNSADAPTSGAPTDAITAGAAAADTGSSAAAAAAESVDKKDDKDNTDSMPDYNGICQGKLNTDDEHCKKLKNSEECLIGDSDKCKWTTGVINFSETSKAEQNFSNSNSGFDPNGKCKPGCNPPRQPTGNCIDTAVVAADGSQKLVKLCPQTCTYTSLDRDNKHCKYAQDCKGCPAVEFDLTKEYDSPFRTDENKYYYQGQYVSGSDLDFSKQNTPDTSTSSSDMPNYQSYTPPLEFQDDGIIDSKLTQSVLEEKDIIPSDIDLNIDHATNFTRVGNNVLNKIASIRNLDMPTISDSDKELLGRAYRQVYEIKQGNDPSAIKAMEVKFQKTLIYVLTQTKLESSSVSWDTPKQTSSLDSTTGMFNDNSNSFFAQGEYAKNRSEKPEGGLCLWNGCDNSRRKPYDSIWSLY